MRYYTIDTNGGLTIADSIKALSRFYDEILELPEDYVEGKYIVVDGEKEIDVPDYDEDGNPIMIEYEDIQTVIDYDEEGNPTGTHEITVIKQKQSTHKETVPAKVLVLNPSWEEEQAKKREAEFNKAFFKTSLGYIRRSVTMQNGSKKDFLSDLMPTIKMGLESGIPVNILAYDKPPFDKDVADWTKYQHIEVVTPQFIQECFMQLSNDFLPINED